MSYLEWLSFATGLIYVFLAARNNVWCWIWGIFSCVILSYLSFTKYLLYADGFIQIVYVMMGFWGLATWKAIKADQKLPIKKLSYKYHLLLIVIGLSISYVSGLLLDKYTPAFATYLDSVTTVFGMIATFLLIYKFIGNWVYWIIIDIIMSILYIQRGGILTGLLMIVYTVFAIYGLYQWQNKAITKN